MQNPWKLHYYAADNKAYRVMQSEYANCIIKLKILD